MEQTTKEEMERHKAERVSQMSPEQSQTSSDDEVEQR